MKTMIVPKVGLPVGQWIMPRMAYILVHSVSAGGFPDGGLWFGSREA